MTETETAADLFVVDLTLPGEDGLSLSRRLRAARPQVGIVMVTNRRQPVDRLGGYEHGADLYLPKPTEPDELRAAIAALARRLPDRSAAVGTLLSPLTLDTMLLRLTGPAEAIELTPSEAALLEALARAPRRQLGLIRIAELLGQDPENPNKASLEVRIVRLRRKLSEASANTAPIKSIRGIGYQLCVALVVA